MSWGETLGVLERTGVLELVRRLAPALPALRARSGALGDQMERALISVPLDVAEGAYSRGRNRQARFQSAAASAREALACWETAQALGWVGPLEPEIAALFHRVIGTLVRLALPGRRASPAADSVPLARLDEEPRYQKNS